MFKTLMGVFMTFVFFKFNVSPEDKASIAYAIDSFGSTVWMATSWTLIAIGLDESWGDKK